MERSRLPFSIGGFTYEPLWNPHDMNVVVTAMPHLHMVKQVQKDEIWSE